MDQIDSSDSLVALDAAISQPLSEVSLTGKDLSLHQIEQVARFHRPTTFTTDVDTLKKLRGGYSHMLDQVKQGVPIYGCNSGYGARAEVVLNKGSVATRLKTAQSISESIVHTDISVGPELTPDVIRGGMLIRLNMLVNGVSALRLEDLDIWRQLLNSSATPVVNAYGGLGASGDLAHNSRVVSVLRQLPTSQVRDAKGRLHDAASYLPQLGIPKLKLQPKAGLGFCNGDNFSTSAAALVVLDVLRYSLLADVLGAMVVEVLRGSTRTFHPFLAQVRPHPGQAELAQLYLYLLSGSRLAYQETKEHLRRPAGVNIQDGYSLRCITQSEGINREFLKWAIKTIEINANSVSDNPLWVSPDHVTPGEEPWHWVSGGNFFAIHMAEVLDSMRKITTRLIKRNDRHLHRMVSPHLSNGLPANLSDPKALSSCTFKGIQLQSGMLEVYSMMLAQPVTTMFGVHEENNQDITPHSLTSAILAWDNLRLLRYSLAMNFLAVAQAVDLRGGPTKLSKHTRPVYEFIRERAAYVTTERPLHAEIETIAAAISAGEMNQLLREKVFSDFSAVVS